MQWNLGAASICYSGALGPQQALYFVAAPLYTPSPTRLYLKRLSQSCPPKRYSGYFWINTKITRLQCPQAYYRLPDLLSPPPQPPSLYQGESQGQALHFQPTARLVQPPEVPHGPRNGYVVRIRICKRRTWSLHLWRQNQCDLTWSNTGKWPFPLAHPWELRKTMGDFVPPAVERTLRPYDVEKSS